LATDRGTEDSFYHGHPGHFAGGLEACPEADSIAVNPVEYTEEVVGKVFVATLDITGYLYRRGTADARTPSEDGPVRGVRKDFPLIPNEGLDRNKTCCAPTEEEIE